MNKHTAILCTYKYRLYPRKAEARALELMLQQGCEVYNAALAECKNTYTATGKGVHGLAQWAYFRDWRKQDGILLNASSLQHLLRRLDKAYTAFFRRVKAGEAPGHPRYKPLQRFNSLEYTYGDGCKLHSGEQPRFYVQNVGEIKIKFHRPLPEGAVIKQVVLKRSNNKWFVCLQLEMTCSEIVARAESAIGIDMGLLRLLTTSDGDGIDNPRWLRQSLARLRVAQRRLARRKRGGANRRKAAAQVARLHKQVANQRRDFWHKTTRQLVDRYTVIAIEELTLGFMTRNPHLSLSAHDAGLGMFRQLLAYKAANAGTQVVAVAAHYTSQVCSGCGAVVLKALSVRTHDCPHCSLSLDRDLNAARNILALAFKSARTEPLGANVAPLPTGKPAGKRKRSLRSLPL